MADEFDNDDDVLDLKDEVNEDDADPQHDDDDSGDDDEGEAFIGFADEEEGGEEETPLIKKLREQVRTLSRKAAQAAAAPAHDDDPEPQVGDRPRSLADFDYDEDRFNAAVDAYDAAKDRHAEWKIRQAGRETERKKVQEAQARQIEQQRKALGVRDYEERAALVKDRLTDQQLAVLIQAADDPARMIYALGRSEAKLDQVAGEENLAKLAALVGRMEGTIKVTKGRTPDPETRVRGATASSALRGADKELARLEKEAERTGDRTKLIQYRRRMQQG